MKKFLYRLPSHTHLIFFLDPRIIRRSFLVWLLLLLLLLIIKNSTKIFKDEVMISGNCFKIIWERNTKMVNCGYRWHKIYHELISADGYHYTGLYHCVWVWNFTSWSLFLIFQEFNFFLRKNVFELHCS